MLTKCLKIISQWRLFPKSLHKLPLEALPMMVLMVVVVLMVLSVALPSNETRHPRPHTEMLAPLEPLRTRWNLTCPSPTEAKVGVVKVAAAEDDELPLDDVVPCVERETWQRSERRGDHWVLYDYAAALERPLCWQAVTLTTHGDFTFLGNLGALVRRWRAPISLALYAPGDDLQPTVRAILWARTCVEPPLVVQHVSFHVVMDSAHLPDTVLSPTNLFPEDVLEEDVNCSSEEAPWNKVSRSDTYRWRHGLRYPINVARNVAREMAQTHFVLPSDLELLPSAGLSDAFLAMILRKQDPGKLFARRVFVLPVFEVQLGVQPPENKSQLVSQLRSGKAVPFHEQLCPECHAIPRPQRWVCAPPRTDGALGVTAVAMRRGKFSSWEALYIGTHREPLYDERLSWEGLKDKQVQSYTMCLLDYRFYVLDDAFLVHQPGVKAPNSHKWRAAFIRETNELIESSIKPELTKLYGRHKWCSL